MGVCDKCSIYNHVVFIIYDHIFIVCSVKRFAWKIESLF